MRALAKAGPEIRSSASNWAIGLNGALESGGSTRERGHPPRSSAEQIIEPDDAGVPQVQPETGTAWTLQTFAASASSRKAVHHTDLDAWFSGTIR